ncbi:MAG TPA: histidine kinase [Verrucomicrobiae bacterium]|nr:histidine kinase [Verrucomicrobiae bacterium]
MTLRHLCAAPLLGMILLYLAATTLSAQEANVMTLTNASQVLSLPADRAILGENVRVVGVVTVFELNWDGRFFVQDETGGVFVDNPKGESPRTGDLVEVTGITHPGAFAPDITKPHWRKLGTAPLPVAKVVPIEQLMAGVEDSQRVEVVGIVREAAMEGDSFRVTLANAGYRLRTYSPVLTNVDPLTLVGSQVRVRGTAAASYNAELRHLITVALYVPQAGDFVVERPALADPFESPILPLNNIAQYRKGAKPEERVHVKGVVTYQRLGEDLFIQDSTGGLQVKSLELQQFAPGDVIEAVGFAGIQDYLPVLEDATFRKTSEPQMPVEANQVSLRKLELGLHHADFVAMEGTLLDRNLRPFRQARTGKTWVQTSLLLQSSNLYFTGVAETPAADANLEAIPLGSRMEVRGICMTQSGEDGKFKSLQVLLPSPQDFRILARPSWLTPRRLGIALGILLAVVLVAVSWSIMISRKNSELNVQIREKEEAQAELQDAHDQLEMRVKERTEQLKIQIAGRKESEIQFKGVLAERTRLAQELHDTLEQTLASIALQFDTCAKLFRKDADMAGYHLELGRNILAQSQVDLRRSVWDLRSRALEQFSLRGALATSSKQITDGTGIKLQVHTTGVVRPLPEIIEENLLRIAQEALTNTIKHSRAERAEMNLDYGPQSVSLQIADDGCGFAVGDHAGPREGHFGLLGISERVQRIGGKLAINSNAGSGTVIRVEVPTETVLEIQWSSVGDANGELIDEK